MKKEYREFAKGIALIQIVTDFVWFIDKWIITVLLIRFLVL